MIRVIFLDIDGVLWGMGDGAFDPDHDIKITHHYPYTSRMSDVFLKKMQLPCTHPVLVHELNPAKIAMLAELINSRHDVKVVISSTWRILFDYQFMDELLHVVCPKWKRGTVIGQTPDLNTERGWEIHQWLTAHDEEFGGVKSFVIIDDNSDAGSHDHDRLVRTDGLVGITVRDVAKVMGLFNIRKAGKLNYSVIKNHV